MSSGSGNDSSSSYVDYVRRTNFIADIDQSPRPDELSDYLYSKISDKNEMCLINVPGIIEFSSAATGTCSKRGYVKKRFRPLVPELPSLMINTNRLRQRIDMYVIVGLELRRCNDARHRDQYELFGSIQEYLIEVNNVHADMSGLMKRIATGHWKRKYDKNYESSISIHDITPSRIDYYGHEIIMCAIDPEGCEDVDDALSIRSLSNDVIELGIHIADPSSYLIEDSELDQEMLRRSESVYLMGAGPIHMFPEELTKNVFSLRAGKRCRAFSILFHVNKLNGTYVIDCESDDSVRIVKTVVELDRNMSYEEFDDCVSRTDSDCSPDLHTLYDVGRTMYTNLVKIDDDYDSKKMVQAFMVYANSVVAQKLVTNCNVNGGVSLIRSQPVTSYKCDVLAIPGSEEAKYIEIHSRLKYRSAWLKLYSGNETTDMHTGVHQVLYTHFTSPIRRYSDILVHRLLWNAISDQSIFKVTSLRDKDSYLKTLFTLNHYKRHYKRTASMERDRRVYQDLCALLDASDRTIGFDCIVVSIESECYCSVQITGVAQIEKYDVQNVLLSLKDRVFRTKIVDRKMMESMNIDAVDLASTSTYEIIRSNSTIVSVEHRDKKSVKLFESTRVLLTFTIERITACLEL